MKLKLLLVTVPQALAEIAAIVALVNHASAASQTLNTVALVLMALFSVTISFKAPAIYRIYTITQGSVALSAGSLILINFMLGS